MMITLIKKASWGGKSHKSGSSHDVDDRVADKLIFRGYAEVYTPPEEVEDGPASDE